MACTVDTRPFMAFMDAAVRSLGSDKIDDAVLRPELGKVLDTAVRYTDSSTPQEMEELWRYRLNRKFNTYGAGEVGGRAKGVYPRISVTHGGTKKWWVDRNRAGARTFYIMTGGRRWSNARWAAYQAEEADRVADLNAELAIYLPKARAAAGLKKKSWAEIGDALGIPVKLPAYARNSQLSSGATFINGNGTRAATPDNVIYTLTNSMPALVRSQGEGILQRAFDTRATAIEIALRKFVFDDLGAAAKRFPGIVLAAA